MCMYVYVCVCVLREHMHVWHRFVCVCERAYYSHVYVRGKATCVSDNYSCYSLSDKISTPHSQHLNLIAFVLLSFGQNLDPPLPTPQLNCLRTIDSYSRDMPFPPS